MNLSTDHMQLLQNSLNALMFFLGVAGCGAGIFIDNQRVLLRWIESLAGGILLLIALARVCHWFGL